MIRRQGNHRFPAPTFSFRVHRPIRSGGHPPDNAIQLTLQGQDLTSSLALTGGATEKTAAVAGLASNLVVGQYDGGRGAGGTSTTIVPPVRRYDSGTSVGATEFDLRCSASLPRAVEVVDGAG